MQLLETIATQKTMTLEALAKDTELAAQVQTQLVRLGLLDPPADGKFGRFSSTALKNFRTLMKISESGLGPNT